MKPIDAPADGAAAKFSLYPSEQCPDVVRVTHNFQHTVKTEANPNGFQEFLLLEQKAEVGVDSIQGRSGLVIFHVDEAKSPQNYHPNWGMNRADEVRQVGCTYTWAVGEYAICSRNSPKGATSAPFESKNKQAPKTSLERTLNLTFTSRLQNPHYYLKVEQADGSDELECGTDNGHQDDLLAAGASMTDRGANFNTKSYSRKRTPNATNNVITVARYTEQSGAFGTGSIATIDVTNDVSGPAAASNPTNAYNPSCIAGQYSNNTGSCNSCPIGKYNPHAASASSVACISACQVCPDGKYSDTPGATACAACPAGKYDAVVKYPNNAASCLDCSDRDNYWGGKMLDPIYDETEEYCRDNAGAYTTAHREWVQLQLENGGECEEELKEGALASPGLCKRGPRDVPLLLDRFL